MAPARRKTIARGLLGLGVILGLAWLARLDYARKISTDVLDLIPAGERAPELALVRTLAGECQARVVLLALTVPPRDGEAAETAAARRDRATAALAATLARSPAFAEVQRMDDPAPRNALGTHLFRQRFDLLLPGWLAARAAEHTKAATAAPWSQWLAERIAADLETFLAKPEALAFQPLLPADPLLLAPGGVERLQGVNPAGGPGAGNEGPALVWARTVASPLTEEGQGPVAAAVAEALAAARAEAPEATLAWSAISRLAAESRRRIEAEMSGLNLFSLWAVLAVAAASVRRVPKALHLLPVMLCALLGGWVGVTLVFARVHVLVFVIGSLLDGVAVDYGFYLYLQPPKRPGEPYGEKVGRLLRPLLASALTTVIGFSLLLCSDLPLIRQLGVFVSAGLLVALGAALLWFAQVDDPCLATRDFIRRRLPGEDAGWGRRLRRGLLAAGAVVAVAGPWRLHWYDDIRELEIPAPALRVEDRAVRALFGETPGRAVYLTRGDDPAAARAALDRFLVWHERNFPGQAATSLGLALPTAEEWAALPAHLAGLDDLESRLRIALAAREFAVDEFEPFFQAWREWRARAGRPTYLETARALTRSLQGSLALLMAAEPGTAWFATVTEHPPGPDAPAETATVSMAQLETLNRLFARYRVSTLRLSACGLGLIGLSVFALYGLRRGVRIFALPAGACLFAFGLFGLAGQTMNLFHLFGAFLGVCLSHNYAIFSAENAARGETPPPSIRLSALTTAASFGVLALSRIPVVAALGSTVALIVLAALVFVELAPFTPVKDAGRPPA